MNDESKSQITKLDLKRMHARSNKGSNVSSQFNNKRSYKYVSYNAGGKQVAHKVNGRQGRRRKYSLVTKFLLGGNITDPLNLNGLDPNEVQWSPAQSPLPVPLHRKFIPRINPRDRSDPLNLNFVDDTELELDEPIKKKKKRNRKRLSYSESNDVTSDVPVCPETPVLKCEVLPPNNTTNNSAEKPSSINIAASKVPKICDKIVSPVVPQVNNLVNRKRRRTVSSETNDIPSPVKDPDKVKLADVSQQNNKLNKVPKRSKSTSNRNNEFIYGNYNRYYGYRNPSNIEDDRLNVMEISWFEGKDVLDIGCNVGHISLHIAKEFGPKKIVGCDIDRKLLKAAKTNIRNYMSDDFPQFPISMKKYGPLAAPVIESNRAYSFPHNVHFMHCNYALDNDEQLALVQEEYDVILALSITKWIHLHNGDEGLKRCFKRMFKQLRPGGKLILEPQSWDSYKKKKKLTESIFKAFKAIKFKPDFFKQYLLSKQVGFTSCENLPMPFNKSKGFSRPVMVFIKPHLSAYSTPRTRILNSESTTPIHFYSGFNASFTIGSESATPHNEILVNSTSATPIKDYQIDSLPGTPFKDYITDSKCATPSKDSYCSICDNTSPRSTPSNKCLHSWDDKPLGELRTHSAPSSLYQYDLPKCDQSDK